MWLQNVLPFRRQKTMSNVQTLHVVWQDIGSRLFYHIGTLSYYIADSTNSSILMHSWDPKAGRCFKELLYDSS